MRLARGQNQCGLATEGAYPLGVEAAIEPPPSPPYPPR